MRWEVDTTQQSGTVSCPGSARQKRQLRCASQCRCRTGRGLETGRGGAPFGVATAVRRWVSAPPPEPLCAGAATEGHTPALKTAEEWTGGR